MYAEAPPRSLGCSVSPGFSSDASPAADVVCTGAEVSRAAGDVAREPLRDDSDEATSDVATSSPRAAADSMSFGSSMCCVPAGSTRDPVSLEFAGVPVAASLLGDLALSCRRSGVRPLGTVAKGPTGPAPDATPDV